MENNSTSDLLVPFDDEPQILDDVRVRAGLVLLYGFIFLACFVGNVAMILVVTLQWKSRSVTRFCLGNMALANLSVSVFCILQNLTLYLLDTWIFGDILCKMYHFINSLCHTASVLILVLVSIERYMVLIHPEKAHQFLSLRRLVLIMLGVWLLSALISFPRFFYFGIISIPLNDMIVGDVCVPKKSTYNSATVDTIHFVLLYVVPVGVISVLYTRIALFLRRSEKLNREQEPDWNNLQGSNPSAYYNKDAIELKATGVMRGKQNCETRETVCVQNEHVHSNTSSGFAFTFRGRLLPIQGSDVSCSEENTQSNRGKHRPHCPHRRQSLEGVRFISTVEVSGNSNDYTYVARNMRRPSARQELSEALNEQSGEKTVGHGHLRCFRNAHQDASHNDGHSHHIKSNIIHVPKNFPPTSALSPDAQVKLYRYNRIRLSRIRWKQRQSVIRMLTAIVVTFAVLNLPFHVRKLCLNYLPSYDMASHVNNLLAPLSFVLMYANCAVNPILYAFMSQHFRSSLKDLCLHCRWKRS